jgi:hypothetical protein
LSAIKLNWKIITAREIDWNTTWSHCHNKFDEKRTASKS